MRTRITSALATGAVMAASAMTAAPAGAAPRTVTPGGRCAITINVAPHRITAGDPVVIFGGLRCPVHGGQTVRLLHRLADAPAFTFVQSTRTDANGFYEFSRADGVVNTNRSWFVISRGVRSRRASAVVAAQVALNGPPQTAPLQTGPRNAVTFSGSVTPADVGARVILQRQNSSAGDDWRRIDAGRVGPGGSFSITHTLKVPGDANIRVLVRSQGRNVPSPSNVLSYVIDQAQNPALTIAASQDPIAFGQSVVISGTLQAGALQPVTLYGRTADSGWSVVAAAVTDASGNYTFPAQSPAHSTAYQVRALKRGSAILYEGVRDQLTAQASATTVQAGQPVTFSGSVSPAHGGHVIYLERQNSANGDFHVVQVATVGADSSYTITHRFYDAGTRVVRVYIPGGPENQGAPSSTFTIAVTPAPAAALTPERPSNSTAPSSGQQ